MPDAPPQRRPDALIVPDSWRQGPTQYTRIDAVLNKVEPIFGCQRGQARIRHQGSYLFITTDPADTMMFPTDHPRSGEPRYTWEDQGDGVKHGFRVPDEATEAETPADREARLAALGKVRDAKILQWKGLVDLGDARTPEQTTEMDTLHDALFGGEHKAE